MPALRIRPIREDDAGRVQEQFARIGWSKPDGYFAACCRQQEADELLLLLAEFGGDYVGHCKVVWTPPYPYFADNGIPEIQDLNVLGDHRGQGIATRLLDEAEGIIAERSPIVGIGFGLHADYGPAHRLYVRRGYVPDGRGVTHGDVAVVPGRSYPVDDDLTLHLVKRLG